MTTPTQYTVTVHHQPPIPPAISILLTLGCPARLVASRLNCDGQPENFPPDAAIVLRSEIGHFPAPIDGPNAEIVIPASITDKIRNRTRWQVLIAHNGHVAALAAGRFVRHDGDHPTPTDATSTTAEIFPDGAEQPPWQVFLGQRLGPRVIERTTGA